MTPRDTFILVAIIAGSIGFSSLTSGFLVNNPDVANIETKKMRVLRPDFVEEPKFIDKERTTNPSSSVHSLGE